MLRLAETPVSTLQTAPLIVEPMVTVSKVIGVLRENEAYEVFIPQASKIGMATIRDIVAVSNLYGKISGIMKYVPKLTSYSTIGEAARIMTQYRIRALPILTNNKIEGTVTALSIMNALLKTSNLGVKAKNIMTPHPITVTQKDTVAKARMLMQRRRIDHLPVLDHMKPVGITTSSHIVFAMIPPESVDEGYMGIDAAPKLKVPVRGIMDSKFLVCQLEDDCASVLSNMLQQRQSGVLVTLWNELQGIITYRDFVKQLAAPSELSDIPVYIIGLPDDPFEAELAKDKFIRVVNTLRKAFPTLQEAKATIKTSASKKSEGRHLYEVKAALKTPREVFNYSEVGWDLPSMFDKLKDRMSRLLAQRRGRMKSRLFKEGPPP